MDLFYWNYFLNTITVKIGKFSLIIGLETWLNFENLYLPRDAGVYVVAITFSFSVEGSVTREDIVEDGVADFLKFLQAFSNCWTTYYIPSLA